MRNNWKSLLRKFDLLLLVISGSLLALPCFGQTKSAYAFYSYIFNTDSLNGFDEVAAGKSAISENFLGQEYNVRMYQLKRSYINSKFGLIQKQPFFNQSFKLESMSSMPICVNEDFEATPTGTITSLNQVGGWSISRGAYTGTNNACNLLDCCPIAPYESAIISSSVNGYYDPIIGLSYPIYSVFGTLANAGYSFNPTMPNMSGNNFIRINSSLNNYSIEKASKTFSVTAANSLFQFAFISVFATGHLCCDAPTFQLKLTNVTNSTALSCPGLSLSPPSTACTNSTPVQYYVSGSNIPYTNQPVNIIYNKWTLTTLDLTPFIGQIITIDFIATDCDAGGHYGYTYIDAQCSAMNLLCNSNTVSAISNSINVSSCGSASVSIVAPTGLGPYAWSGPSTTTLQSTPSFSNQTFTTTVPGNYTLTMNSLGSCSPIIKLITVSLTPAPAPLIISGTNSICSNVAASFTVSGASTYTWSTGVNTSSMTDSPLTNTIYVVNSTDSYNCANTASVALMVITQPTLSISGANSVCIGSGVTYSITGAGSLFLNSNAISNTVNVLPSSTSVYTILGSNSTCSDTQTIILSVDPTCAYVWPGDANSDGLANNLDILELGLHITQTGSPRTSISNVWQSCYANNWIGTITNGKNLCHSDCNGDGIINSNDAAAISLNYNLTHAFRSNIASSMNPQLDIQADQNFVNNGQWGSASVYLGDNSNPIVNLNGLAFSLNFDNVFIQSDSVSINYPNSFLNVNSDNLNFNKNQFTNGVIYSASTHTNNTNVNGNGKIATFYFKVVQQLGFDTIIKLNLLNAYQSNANGIITALSTASAVILLKATDVGLRENASENTISIYPNPSNGIIKITSAMDLKKIEVYGLDGKLVLSESAKNHSHSLSLSTQKEGIYFIKIHTSNNSMDIRKIALIKN